MTETEWLKTVTTAARTFGWEFMHIGRTGKHTANGAKGTLGKGWPDLILLKPGRLLAVELKADGAVLPEEQKLILLKLMNAGAETYVWRPKQWAEVMHTLSGGA